MYIVSDYNRPRPSHLLVESVRTPDGPRRRTVHNLSRLSEAQIDGLRTLLKGGVALGRDDQLAIEGGMQHGAVAAALTVARRSGLIRAIAPRRSRFRDLAVAMVIWQLLAPGSKSAVATELGPTGRSSLRPLLGITGEPSAKDMLAALDWLVLQQPAIERRLAALHLDEGCSVLYDTSSSYFEGEHAALGAYGYSRDHRPDRPQVLYGLLCATDGHPVAVEAFPGNTADSATVASQVDKLRHRFGLRHVVLVGDRGMVPQTVIDRDLAPEGFGWITTYRTPSVAKLVAAGAVTPAALAGRTMLPVSAPGFPDERVIVCRNPALQAELAAERDALLDRTMAEFEAVAKSYAAGRIHRDRASRRIGVAYEKWRMGKHFGYAFDPDTHEFRWWRDDESIAAAAALDGLFVIRAHLPAGGLDDVEIVCAYKRLARIERDFRGMKGELGIQPFRVRLEHRIRGHVLLCMLAYHLALDMRQALAPMLFADETPPPRPNPVIPARRSAAAERKIRRGRTADGAPLRSFEQLLRDMERVMVGRARPAGMPPGAWVPAVHVPEPWLQHAFDLLGCDPWADSLVTAALQGDGPA